MKRRKYEKELEKLQIRLAHLQRWIKEKGLRVIIVFEGRDGAGKGGTIRALTERLSPRVFRIVALPAPSDREKSQMYLQRYVPHFPAAGEVVIFDRSWYNRAGVEYVMGFCSPEQHRRFLKLCPEFERYVIQGGTLLLKIWLEVSPDEQKRRFEARIHDPVRQWKLSPMDLPSLSRWYDYSRARHEDRPVVHRPIRRQEGGAAQHDRAHPADDSAPATAAQEGRPAGALEERRVQRPQDHREAALRQGALLSAGARR